MLLEIIKIDQNTFESFLRECYGLQKFKVEQIASPSGGCFRIHTTTADGVAEELLCKVNNYFNPANYAPYCGVFKICHPSDQALVLRHLMKSEVRCPQPVRSILGNDAEIYGDPQTVATVMSYMPGEVLYIENFDAQARYDFGALAAHYRLAMKDFKHEAFPKWTPEEILTREDLPNLLRMCEPMEDANREKLRHILSGCHDNIRRHMEKLPVGLCHGDLWAGNVIKLEGAAVDASSLDRLGLIDFDCCGTSFWVIDFGHIFVYDVFNADTVDIPSTTRPLLDGYLSVCALTEDEKKLLQTAVCYNVAKVIILAINIPADFPYPFWQEMRRSWNVMFSRVVELWEGDRDDLYKTWFGDN